MIPQKVQAQNSELKTQNSKLVLKIGGNELDDPAFVALAEKLVA